MRRFASLLFAIGFILSAFSPARSEQVRGSAARVDDRLLAARVPKPDTNSITVEVRLPQDDAQTDHNNFCNIGRLAEVRFERSGFAFVDGLGQKLQQLAGYFKRDAPLDQAASK